MGFVNCIQQFRVRGSNPVQEGVGKLGQELVVSHSNKLLLFKDAAREKHSLKLISQVVDKPFELSLVRRVTLLLGIQRHGIGIHPTEHLNYLGRSSCHKQVNIDRVFKKLLL